MAILLDYIQWSKTTARMYSMSIKAVLGKTRTVLFLSEFPTIVFPIHLHFFEVHDKDHRHDVVVIESLIS